MSATITTTRPRRKSADIERQFAGGGKTDFALISALVPNDPDARAILRREAAKRGLSVEGILRRIVDTMIADGLFSAVLDDADEKGNGTEYYPLSRGGGDAARSPPHSLRPHPIA